MLALAVHQRWEVHHLDIKSAFLNGDSRKKSTSRNRQASSSPAARTRSYASARRCTVFVKHPGPRMPSSTTP
jgi:hypothetical protein